ncbi:MAG TPA: thioredoxin domain-containing protein [Bryobacteraceae bacterium]|nr:thioredoxin domain-containing protein [Bryobacteraceae bacterium]HUO31892.1 thioredoxin domain-containing protein [Bryobacteraceae bacterium]
MSAPSLLSRANQPKRETDLPNHLIAEKSPYLQQHAHNPVDWYPWGSDAFEKARGEDKPIFLSIGYSTCHWCHVMERESFENDAIAAILNRSFVAIKVDREERPDVDRIYMTFVQASTGSGGWPMSVFLTPDLKPFFGGTYFPPDNRYGRPGFGAILERIGEAWKRDRERIEQSSSDVVVQLTQYSAAPSATGVADKAVLDAAFQHFRRMFDSAHAGFGSAPKFPRPVVFNFLLRYYARTHSQEALSMTLETLRAMANGGMHDQLGGGFHRYSVDERWFVPHFEKMLYDQAQLAISYLEAFQITHDPFYARIARSTLDYVLRDMTHPDGGFYSAEDADSVIDPAQPKVKGEGAFYVWTAGELRQALGDDFAVFAASYGVEENGNVQDDPHGEFPGKNILYVLEPAPEQLAAAKAKLLELRSHRVRPHLDDKILTAWNGLMISAFAKAAQVLQGDVRYLAAAQRAAEFILTRMYDARSGILQRRFRDGEAAIDGFLDDYAFFANALLDLYEADFDPRHLETALALATKMRELFEDPEDGAFFSTAVGDPSLVLRMKDDYDGAEPSGNSVALLVLLRLAHLTDRTDLREAADRTLRALASKIAAQPVAVPQLLVALDYWLGPRREIVIAGEPHAALARDFLSHVRARFLPNTVTLLAGSDGSRERLARVFPAAANMEPIAGQPTAYVCQDYVCQLPTIELSKFDELLQ